MSSSETCGHPAGAPQLLGTVAIKHLWRFVYDFQVYPPQCASDATGTFPTYHQQQARTPLPSAEPPWLSMCVVGISRSDHAMQENCVTFQAASQQRAENCWVTGTHTRQWTHSITTKWKIPMANTALGSQQQADCCCWVHEDLCKETRSTNT